MEMERNSAVVDLSQEQQDKLGRYQEIANEGDKQKSIGVLQSVKWDLNTAIEKLLTDDVSVHTARSDDVDSDEDTWQGTSAQPINDSSSSSYHSGPLSTLRYSSSDSDEPDVLPDVADNDATVLSCVGRSASLVPQQVDNVDEAIANFGTMFEARYGKPNPTFYPGTLRDALKEAFEAMGRSVLERRPLAIYLHSDHSVASNIFAKEVMCAEHVSRLFNRQYVVWGWDCTHRSNWDLMMGWLELNNIRDSIRVLTKTPASQYPMLLVITKEAGVTKLLDYCTGFDTQSDVMQKLMSGIDVYQHVKTAEEAEERQRQERELMRQEQKKDYDEALARDRAMQESAEKERKLQREEEMKREVALLDKANHMKLLLASLPVEPCSTAHGVIMVRLRYPDGTSHVRRFRNTEPLQYLMTFIESQGFDMHNHCIFNADVPKKDVALCFDLNASFADLNWPIREQVFIEEK